MSATSATSTEQIGEEASLENHVRAKGYSEKVTRSRLAWLRMFSRWAGKPLALCTKSDVLDVVERIRRYRGNTPFQYAAALSAYYGWVKKTYPGFQSPLDGVELPAIQPDAEKPFLSADQVRKLLQHIRRYGSKEFYWACVIAARHLMRAGELLPWSFKTPKAICDCPAWP